MDGSDVFTLGGLIVQMDVDLWMESPAPGAKPVFFLWEEEDVVWEHKGWLMPAIAGVKR